MKNSALLVVDPQYDFMPGGALEVPDGDKIIPVINKLISNFDTVIFTKDWHPRNHKSFASQHPGKNVFDKIELNGLEQILWPDHCIQHTKGSDLHKYIDFSLIKKDFYLFKKGIDPEIDSYSAFYDNGKKNSTGLTEFLKGKDITKVHIVGLAMDFCVKFTAIDSVKDGFETTLILDGTRPINPNTTECISDLKREGVILLK